MHQIWLYDEYFPIHILQTHSVEYIKHPMLSYLRLCHPLLSRYLDTFQEARLLINLMGLESSVNFQHGKDKLGWY
jgi:hypothetical protein